MAMSHNRRRKDREPYAYWAYNSELTSKFIEQSGNKGNKPNDTMVRMAEYYENPENYWGDYSEFDEDGIWFDFDAFFKEMAA